jgi:hypothetical protein
MLSLLRKTEKEQKVWNIFCMCTLKQQGSCKTNCVLKQADSFSVTYVKDLPHFIISTVF